MVLGDCTFVNQLMVDCSYAEVSITVESIGGLFGMSEIDLLGLGLIYLGQPVVGIEAARGLLDALETEYSQRRWLFMREILRLNFHRVPLVVGLNACFDALLWPASIGVPLKAADIRFFEMVIEELFSRQELPGMTALAIPEMIRRFLSENSGKPAKQDLRLQQLGGRLRIMLLDMLQTVTTAIQAIGAEGEDQMVTARITFGERPQQDIPEFMRALAAASGFHIAGPTLTLCEMPGSFKIELSTTLLTLGSLWTALWLLNGCAAQAIELKARVQIFCRKRLPKVIQQRALMADQDIPRAIALSAQGIFTVLSRKAFPLTQVAHEFSRSNVQRIRVVSKKRKK
jgi:hypothetical protein